MNKLHLSTQLKPDTVAVPVELFGDLLSSASGEAVKVYLCLLRASQDASQVFSLEEVADRFDLTQKKLAQILAFWEEQGFLALSRSGAEISGAELLKPGARKEGPAPAGEARELPEREAREIPAAEIREIPAAEIREIPALRDIPEPYVPAGKPLELDDLYKDDAFSELLALAEYYCKRPVSVTLRETLGNVYLLFNRQPDVVEYLLEYCIEQGHQSPAYMESVARGWRNEGFTSLEEVRTAAQSRNRTAYSVKKAFGITNRALVRDESALLEQWVKKFDLELVLEACGRTMAAIHKPSFQYADGILKAWEEKGVKTMRDVENIDREWKAKQTKPADSGSSGRDADKSRNTFRNFDQRKTDYSELIPDYYRG